MEFKEIIELINTISDSKVTSFTIEEGDKKITIKAGDKAPQVVAPQVVAMPAMTPQAVASSVVPVPVSAGVVAPQMDNTAVNSAVANEASAETKTDANIKTINSPLVGTFYAAPSPDDAPFVSVGDTVKKGQVIGIVEAMKLMNEIESDHDGVITEIMVNNGDMVEYGQVLVKVK
jgi:acetyl-CoA carboxylase biotin carboxyl carrier protein